MCEREHVRFALYIRSSTACVDGGDVGSGTNAAETLLMFLIAWKLNQQKRDARITYVFRSSDPSVITARFCDCKYSSKWCSAA